MDWTEPDLVVSRFEGSMGLCRTLGLVLGLSGCFYLLPSSIILRILLHFLAGLVRRRFRSKSSLYADENLACIHAYYND